jgi:predicted phosphohydrolase
MGARRKSVQSSELGKPRTGGSLRIVCISDTHGLHRRLSLPDGDILIHAGDFMMHGRTVEEIDDFNDWLGGLPHRHRIVIAGNHDLLFESSPEEARAHLTNATYLENSGTTVDGIRLWGCPITPVLSHMAFAVERGGASRKYWDRIPSGTDILITHGPPFGTLDKDEVWGAHMGCQELTRAIIRIKPRLHVFGHVHGGYGREAGPNWTVMVNCALLNGGRLREPVSVQLAVHPSPPAVGSRDC